MPVDALDANAVAYVRMEFIGTRSGAVTYPGARGSGRQYRAGRNATARFHNVHPGDVATLESTGEFKRTAPAVVDHVPARVETPQVVLEAVPMAVGGPELEKVSEVAPVVEATPVVEQVQTINDASGPVKRKRGAAKMGKNTKLRDDLPPLG